MAHHRHELSDAEWAVLEPLLPPRKTAGRPYGEHRRMLNAMLFRLNTGIGWRDLPERYGPWQTVYSRSRRWCRCGLWDRMLQALQSELDAVGRIQWWL
ncbi:transposase [Eleftheria terrae]|uniref:transposase n=1 Tax=Eleftheria terrae TaxID=1597781 RepID=UPI003F4DFF0C